VAVAAVAWSFSHSSSGGNAKAGGGAGSKNSKSASPSTASSVVLKPVGATAADNSGGAAAAIDGSTSTDWHSQWYRGDPVFGGLRKGSGLVIDMGTKVRLSQVKVQFGTTGASSVRIGIGNSDDPTSDSGFTTVASSSAAQGTTKFNVSSSATGRYVMIWYTKLPPLAGSSDQYEAQVYNVVVRGSS
jgi:hypothetical protein